MRPQGESLRVTMPGSGESSSVQIFSRSSMLQVAMKSSQTTTSTGLSPAEGRIQMFAFSRSSSWKSVNFQFFLSASLCHSYTQFQSNTTASVVSYSSNCVIFIPGVFSLIMKDGSRCFVTSSSIHSSSELCSCTSSTFNTFFCNSKAMISFDDTLQRR